MSDISMDYKYYDKLLLKTRREEMEACCRDVCPDCAKGIELTIDKHGQWHRVQTMDGGYFSIPCPARSIRQRWQQPGQVAEEREVY